jgi:hypothetical protein
VIDLSALDVKGGDSVQFRFDIGRDGCGGVMGWWVDNIKLTICKLAATVKAVHRPEPSLFGRTSWAKVTVARDGSTGPAPTGEVTISRANGREIASGSLTDGSARIALPRRLPVGKHTLRATYAGDHSLAQAADTFTATVVRKWASTTTAKVRPERPRYRRDFKVVVRVDANRATPTGWVIVSIDGTKLRSARLDDGRVVLKVTKNLAVGRHKLVAAYQGSRTVGTSRDVLRFRIVR